MMENKPEKRILGVSWSLLAILLLGTTLRFLYLGRQSVWVDEGFSWLAEQMTFRGVTRLSLNDVHPPLYYYFLKASLRVFPDTEFGMRFVSVLFSVAALGVMMTFVCRRWGHCAACYVGLLVAASPFDIYYAQEARMYTLLSLLFVLAFTELVGALEGKPVHLVGWVAATTGLAWTHAYGLLAAFLQIGFLAVYWSWQRLRDRPFPLQPKPVLAALAASLLGAAPIVLLFYKVRHRVAGSVTIPKVSCFLTIVRCWATGPLTAFPAFRIPLWEPGGKPDAELLNAFMAFRIPGWVYGLSTVVTVGCAVLGARQLWRRDAFHRWILYFAAALIALPPALVFAFSTLFHHALWVDRGFLPNAHILYLLTGLGLSAVESRALRGIAAVTIGVSIVTPEIYYYTKFEKSPTASACHALPPFTPQRAVLLSPKWLDEEVYYYLRAEPALWSVQMETPRQLMRFTRATGEMLQLKTMTCDEANLQAVSDIYAFGDADTIRTERKQWPSCLLAKKTWVFERSRWHPIDG
jgi:Dolichyl-phosphate-mannose-protein mannosyltransferase